LEDRRCDARRRVRHREMPALIVFGVDWLASRLSIGQQMAIAGCADVTMTKHGAED
jgi:hypothetical protein